ncbi:MAG: replication-associated recombination protein A [Deltaproteobacteria bacterium]|nr:replication-associated recombination protein A [Deltaproteobacteria bacterium]
MDLFERSAQREQLGQPLAARMRPRQLEDIVGQEHLLGEGKLLRRAIREERLPSLILWGPPGSGKTSIAQVIAQQTGSAFVAVSAIGSGVKDLRAELASARERRDVYRKRTILFIDEIHRFNKAQQDALLPDVEAGVVTLIGATTENPSFEVNAALLSRVRVLRLRGLMPGDLVDLLRRALASDRELKQRKLSVDDAALQTIAEAADGDARRALTALEVVYTMVEDGQPVSSEVLQEATQRRVLLHDKAGEGHYNVVSAMIKSMRGSDVEASVYWMARMIEAGEDPLFVMRRIVIFAAEDIGCADPSALQLAVAAMQAVHFIGLPEAVLPMTQACIHMARAPKSNSALTCYRAAKQLIAETGALPVPLHLRNAPTALMKAEGYGAGYRYPHDDPTGQDYLPELLRGRQFYHAGKDRAFDRKVPPNEVEE